MRLEIKVVKVMTEATEVIKMSDSEYVIIKCPDGLKVWYGDNGESTGDPRLGHLLI